MSKFDTIMFNLEWYGGRYSKAIWAAGSGAILAVAAALGTALADGKITGIEIGIAIGAGLAAGAGGGGTVALSPKNRA